MNPNPFIQNKKFTRETEIFDNTNLTGLNQYQLFQIDSNHDKTNQTSSFY